MTTQALTKKDIVDLLENVSLSDLQKYADAEQRLCCADEVILRAIIEISNVCSRDCIYCGIRKANDRQLRYRMSKEEVLATAEEAGRMGFKTIILQSGEDDAYSVAELCAIVKEIKSRVDCALTISFGEKTREEYQSLKQAGADRYLLKFETSDQVLYSRLKPGTKLETRLSCLQTLKELGYQVGSGIMVGLPKQDTEILVEDILLMKKLDLDMISVGPFVSHPDTPLFYEKNGTLERVLRAIAVTRIVTKNAHIPVTTSTEVLGAQARVAAFSFGANVIMVNVTPDQYIRSYDIYPNPERGKYSSAQKLALAQELILAAGKKPSFDYGHSLKK